MKQLTLTSREFIDLNKEKPKKKNKKEELLQLQIAKYIRSAYPSVIFNSDVASGMKLPKWVAAAAAAQRSERGQPDLIILEPSPCGTYHAMALELKSDTAKLYQKSGKLYKDKHLEEQCNLLARLILKGYYANFSQGYEDTKNQIDKYMIGFK